MTDNFKCCWTDGFRILWIKLHLNLPGNPVTRPLSALFNNRQTPTNNNVLLCFLKLASNSINLNKETHKHDVGLETSAFEPWPQW